MGVTIPDGDRDQVRRSLDHSVKDGCAHAAMVGLGETYIPPFAISLGLGARGVGILGSLPLLVGSACQLLALPAIDRVGRRKPLVVWPALAHGCVWLPILAVPWVWPGRAAEAVVVLVLFYHGFANLAGPAWNSWMGDLVRADGRGDYFGRREQVRILFQLGASLAGGAVLSLAGATVGDKIGYACIFGAAFLARLVSVHYLRSMHEPPYEPASRKDSLRLARFLGESTATGFGRFTLFMALFMGATNISAPFFSLFMLQDLGFDYVQYACASAAIIVAQAITFRAWGRLGDRYGNRTLLVLTAFAVPLLPFLWVVYPRFWAILIYQAIAGVLWAGFNLAALNYLFDAVQPRDRARCAAYYSLIVNAGVFVGSAVAGFLVVHLSRDLVLGPVTVHLVSSLQVLFIVSGLLRMLCAILMVRAIPEVRDVEPFGKVWVRVASLFPIRGMVFSIFTGNAARPKDGGER